MSPEEPRDLSIPFNTLHLELAKQDSEPPVVTEEQVKAYAADEGISYLESYRQFEATGYNLTGTSGYEILNKELPDRPGEERPGVPLDPRTEEALKQIQRERELAMKHGDGQFKEPTKPAITPQFLEEQAEIARLSEIASKIPGRDSWRQ